MKKKRFWNEHATHWQWLSGLFSVAILRYFVVWFSIVPVFLSLFRAIPGKIEINFGKAVLEITPQLPFGWYLLWLSSLCYTAALFIYALRCPEFIKKYPNFGVYSSYGHSPRWLVWAAYEVANEGGRAWNKLAEKLVLKGFASVAPGRPEVGGRPVVDRASTSYYFHWNGQNYVVAMPPPTGCCANPPVVAEAEREFFWEVFGAKSGGRSISRLIILLLLGVSAVLFLITLFQHICAAIPDVLEGLGFDALRLFELIAGVVVSFF